jgi:hypothetical protein
VKNDCREAALRELRAAGIRDIERSYSGKHIQLRWRRDDHPLRRSARSGCRKRWGPRSQEWRSGRHAADCHRGSDPPSSPHYAAPHKRHITPKPVHALACQQPHCALAQASRRRKACLFDLRSTVKTLLGGLRVSHQAAIHFSVFALGNDLLLIFIGFVKWYILRHIIYCGFKYPAKDEINCWAV